MAVAMGMSAADFRAVLSDSMGRTEIDAAMVILENLAKRAGMELPELLARSLEAVVWQRTLTDPQGQPVRAAVTLGQGGRRVLHLARSGADVTTLIHEGVHLVRPFLASEDQRILLEWTGEREWNEAAEERVAWGVEQRLREGPKALDERVREVLQKITAWVRAVYDALFGSQSVLIDGKPVVLNEQVRQVMDGMLTGVPAQVELPSWGDVEAPEGQRAWHGSPARFDEFRTDGMGRGEGRQMRGWGLYFTDEKEIAEYFRQRLAKRPEAASVARELGLELGAEQAGVLGQVAGEDELDDLVAARRAQMRSASLRGFDTQALSQVIRELRKPVGQVYEVSIPTREKMLNWDVSLAEQSPWVQRALAGVDLPPVRAMLGGQRGRPFLEKPELWRGEDLYQELSNAYAGPEGASVFLSSLGIGGIEFADGHTMALGTEARNFVVFDPTQVKILSVMYQKVSPSWALPEPMATALREAVAAGRRKESEHLEAREGAGDELAAGFHEAQRVAWGARVALYQEILDGQRLFAAPNGITYVLHGSTGEERDEYPLQLTSFDESQPTGHSVYGPGNLRDLFGRLNWATLRPEKLELISREEAQLRRLKRELQGSPDWMKAPNGEPTKLNERQWLQVRTEAFRDWFGPWDSEPEKASQILDENGEPLVVWHGTPSSFQEFDLGRVGENSGNEGHYGYGAYFSTDEVEAQCYAWGPEGRVLGAFLNVRKAFDPERDIGAFAEQWGFAKEPVAIDRPWLLSAVRQVDPLCGQWAELLCQMPNDQAWDIWTKDNGGRWPDTVLDPNRVMDWVELSTPGAVPNLQESWIETLRQELGQEPQLVMGYAPWNRPNLLYATDYGRAARDRTQNLREAGYDGVWAGSEVVAFDGRQIKSAEHNRGSFQAGVPNILYQRTVGAMVENHEPLALGERDSALFLRRKLGHASAVLEAGGGAIEVVSLRTPIRHRGQGDARRLMESLVSEADRRGFVLYLSASSLDGRTNQGRLEKFYESLGFEPTGWKANMAGDPKLVWLPGRLRESGAAGREEALLRVSLNHQWMRAPNGEPSRLTERQWLQVRTQAFRDWFGPWDTQPESASRVVDPNGEPRVCYHGTSITDIERFSGNRGVAGHFAQERRIAEDWASSRFADAVDNGNDEEFGDQETIYEVFLAARSTFDPREKECIARLQAALPSEVLRSDYEWDYGRLEHYVDDIRRAGFDSYLDFELGTESEGDRSASVAVYEAAQIKSATENLGTFARDNPSILYQRPIEQMVESLRGQTAKAQREGLGLEVVPEDMAFEKHNPGISHSGVFRHHAEHLGDVVHRVSMTGLDESWGLEGALEKVGREGLARDLARVEQDLEINREASGAEATSWRRSFENAAMRYAQAYREIPVFTKAQVMAREMAVALGERRFGDVVKLAQALESGLSGLGGLEWMRQPAAEAAGVLAQERNRMVEVPIWKRAEELEPLTPGQRWHTGEARQEGVGEVTMTGTLRTPLVVRGCSIEDAKALGAGALVHGELVVVVDAGCVHGPRWVLNQEFVDRTAKVLATLGPRVAGRVLGASDCEALVRGVVGQMNVKGAESWPSVKAAAGSVASVVAGVVEIPERVREAEWEME